MSALTGTAYCWKTSDLDRLPDEPFLRYEIVDGGVIVSKRPDWTHQDMVRKLIVAFDAPLAGIGGKALPEPGIVWGEQAEDSVVPDVAVILRIVYSPCASAAVSRFGLPPSKDPKYTP